MRPVVTRCGATRQATAGRPCTDWINEFGEQAHTVAGGGVVPGRIATGGVVAARAVSGRAAESLAGTHRCIRVNEHVERFGTRHGCACEYEWTDPGPDNSDHP